MWLASPFNLKEIDNRIFLCSLTWSMIQMNGYEVAMIVVDLVLWLRISMSQTVVYIQSRKGLLSALINVNQRRS